MSYYKTYQEIPIELFQEILTKPKDEEFHNKLLDRFYDENNEHENNNNTLFRRLFSGNLMLEHNKEEHAYFAKTRSFYELLSSYTKKYPIRKEVRIASNIIESYVTHEELEETWYAIEELIAFHTEYKVEKMCDQQEVFSEYPSTWDDVVRFYYSCWLNKSVAIKI